jgi:hypothetical protein
MQNPTAPSLAVEEWPQIFLRLSDVEGHEQLARRVWLVRRLAVIQVGRQGGEPLGREAVADVLDVADQSPPLLDHEDAWPLAVLGSRKVSGCRASVGGKLHHLACHARSPFG